MNPLLGMGPQTSGSGGLLGVLGAEEAAPAEGELPARQRQLNEHAHDREQQVAIEVRGAAETVELRLRQIALAKQSLEQAQTRCRDTESRSSTGTATFADVTATRLAAIEAEQDLLKHVVGWKIALARLKQAQGILVAECSP